MKPADYQSKIVFYAELKKDKLVQELECKEEIKEAVNKIEKYNSLTNRLLRENPLGIHNSTQQIRSVNLSFYNIGEIAYAIGTHKDTRGTLEKMFKTRENPIKIKIEEIQKKAKQYIDTNKFPTEFYNTEINDSIKIINNLFIHKEEKLIAIQQINKKLEFYQKEINSLNILKSLANHIKTYQIITPIKKIEKLPMSKIDFLAECFEYQQKINILYHDTINIAGEKSIEFYNKALDKLNIKQ